MKGSSQAKPRFPDFFRSQDQPGDHLDPVGQRLRETMLITAAARDQKGKESAEKKTER